MNDVMYSSSARLPEEARETVLEYTLFLKKKGCFVMLTLICVTLIRLCVFLVRRPPVTMVSSQRRHLDALTTLRCHRGQLPRSW